MVKNIFISAPKNFALQFPFRKINRQMFEEPKVFQMKRPLHDYQEKKAGGINNTMATATKVIKVESIPFQACSITVIDSILHCNLSLYLRPLTKILFLKP